MRQLLHCLMASLGIWHVPAMTTAVATLGHVGLAPSRSRGLASLASLASLLTCLAPLTSAARIHHLHPLLGLLLVGHDRHKDHLLHAPVARRHHSRLHLGHLLLYIYAHLRNVLVHDVSISTMVASHVKVLHLVIVALHLPLVHVRTIILHRVPWLDGCHGIVIPCIMHFSL